MESTLSYSVIIPARYGSTRLPAKALLDIGGKPMIQHVYERACQSGASEVLIATDDERIASAAANFGAEVEITRQSHPSGTDRLQEVVSNRRYDSEQVVVNVQGDEPLIPPAAIDQVAADLLQHRDAGMATLCERIEDVDTLLDSNSVKVVRDQQQRALYFSRAAIPHLRSAAGGDCRQEIQQAIAAGQSWYRHIGIYAYRTATLNDFVTWPASTLEQRESLEQLRALDNGITIICSESQLPMPGGIDTEQDLERVRELLQE